MITTITLNPAIDKIMEISDMELGKVHRVKNQVETLGGKSINVARILAGLNVDTKALCFAGKDNLDLVKKHAKDDGIPLEALTVNGLTRTNVKIVEPDQENRTTDINESGFYIQHEDLVGMDTMIETYSEKSSFIVLSGSLPQGVPADYYQQLVLRLKTKTKVIVDADGKTLKEAMEAGPYLIKPNIHEFEGALNMSFDSDLAIIKAARQQIQTYGISYILISMGGEGSLLVSYDCALRAQILPVNVVSTVGAGDSMLAGVIYGLTQVKNKVSIDNLQTSLSYGVAASAIAIGSKNHEAIPEDLLLDQASQVVIHSL